jgi:hypothetical protein
VDLTISPSRPSAQPTRYDACDETARARIAVAGRIWGRARCYVKIGRAVRYRRGDIPSLIERHVRQSNGEPTR